MPSASTSHPGPAFAQLLDEEAQALDGFPIRPLVKAWLTPKSPTDWQPDRAAGLLLQYVLHRWTTDLAKQLATTARGDGTALARIHHDTQACQNALLRLLGLVEQTLLVWPAGALTPVEPAICAGSPDFASDLTTPRRQH